MKVQIDTIQCRRLYERLRSGRAQLEQAQRDVQHARMHLRAQTWFLSRFRKQSPLLRTKPSTLLRSRLLPFHRHPNLKHWEAPHSARVKSSALLCPIL